MNKKSLIMPIVAICVSAVILFVANAGMTAKAQTNYRQVLHLYRGESLAHFLYYADNS